jgi:hypothetical protein
LEVRARSLCGNSPLKPYSDAIIDDFTQHTIVKLIMRWPAQLIDAAQIIISRTCSRVVEMIRAISKREISNGESSDCSSEDEAGYGEEGGSGEEAGCAQAGRPQDGCP